MFWYLAGHFVVFHQNKGWPGELPPEREELWREALANPDYKLHPHLYNIVTMKGQHMPALFDVLIDPYERLPLHQVPVAAVAPRDPREGRHTRWGRLMRRR